MTFPRFPLVVLCSMTAVLCSSQETPLTVAVRTARLDQVCAELAKLSGKRISVGASLQQELVVLNVKGATVKDTLEHIASSVGGRVVDGESGFALLKSTNATELQERELQAGAASAKERLKAFVERASKLKNFDSTAAETLAKSMVAIERTGNNTATAQTEARNLAAQRPLARTLVRLLAAFDPRQLSESDLIFSTKPNSSQRAFDDTSMLQTFIAEQVTFVEAMRSTATGGARASNVPWALEKEYEPTAETELRLTYSRGDFTLDLLDAKGQLIGSATTKDFVAAKPMATTAATGEVTPSPLSLKLLQWRSIASRTHVAIEDEQLRGFLLHPTKNEPLSLLIPDEVNAVASTTGANVVMQVDDELLPELLTLGKAIPPDAFLQFLQRSGRFTVSQSGNWIVISQAQPSRSKATFSPRSGLEDLLSSAQRDGAVSLQTWAATEASHPLGHGDLLSKWLVEALFPPIYFANFRNIKAAPLRVLAALTGDQIAALQSGKLVPVEELSNAGIEELRNLVSIEPNVKNGQAPDRNSVFARGLPPGGKIRLHSINFPQLLPASSQNFLQGVQGPITGQQQFAARNGFGNQSFNLFWPLQATRCYLSLSFGENKVYTYTFDYNTFDSRSAPVAYSKLDPEFRKSLEVSSPPTRPSGG